MPQPPMLGNPKATALPDDDPFQGIRAKIKRAFEQIEYFEREQTMYGERKPYAVVVDADSPPMQRVYRFYMLEPPPIEWAVILGEAVHNLRSALDHAVYALTVAHTGGPLDGSGFPIFHDKDLYGQVKKTGVPTRASGLYQVRGIGPGPKAYIERCQPYALGVDFADHPLWILQRLWNHDKHRAIHAQIGFSRDVTLNTNGVADVHLIHCPGLLEDRAVVAKAFFDRPVDAKVNMDFRAAFTVAIAETTTTHDKIVTLGDVANLVIDAASTLALWHRTPGQR